uniref:Uncharacterized protein n=2 Tax=Poecilia TaxID=8080 RepID=A0A3B3UE52_9TELE
MSHLVLKLRGLLSDGPKFKMHNTEINLNLLLIVCRSVGAPQYRSGAQQPKSCRSQRVAVYESTQREKCAIRGGTGAAVPCHTDPGAVQGKHGLALKKKTYSMFKSQS